MRDRVFGKRIPSRAVMGLAAALLLTFGAAGGAVAARYVERSAEPGRSLRLYAAMQQINALILASPSATSTLQHWCADHRLAAHAVIVARPVPGASDPVTAQQRAELRVGPNEAVRYRQVRLACGKRVLSVAENWYIPSRLSPEMNRELDTTQTSFGTVVKPLNPTRTTLAVTSRWHVLPDHWDRRGPPRCGAGWPPTAIGRGTGRIGPCLLMKRR